MPKYRVTYLDIRRSTKHEVNVEAASQFIAERNAWDVFVLLREQHRYGTPLKEDYATYSVVETSDGTTEVNPSESNSSDS